MVGDKVPAKKRKSSSDNRIAQYLKQLSEISANGMTPLGSAGRSRSILPGVDPGARNLRGSRQDRLSPGTGSMVMSDLIASLAGRSRETGGGILDILKRTMGFDGMSETKFPQTDTSRAMADINRMILDAGGGQATQQQTLPSIESGLDENALREEALRRVNMMLNPQINALQSQIGTARSNTAAAKSDLDIMYDALAEELRRSSASSSSEMAQAQQMAQQGYGQARKDISGGYGSAVDELAKAIQAGGGDAQLIADTVGKGLSGDKAFLEGLTRGDEAFAKEQADTLSSQLNTLNKQVIGQAGATKVGKMSAADRELNQLIKQITGQISGLQGQRGMMVEDMMAQLMGAQQQAQESALDRQLKELQIAKGTGDLGLQGLRAQQMQQDLLGAPQEVRQGYGSAMDYLGQAGPQYQAAFNQFFSSGDLDERDPGYTIKKLAELAKKNNLDPNVLINAWMRYTKEY